METPAPCGGVQQRRRCMAGPLVLRRTNACLSLTPAFISVAGPWLPKRSSHIVACGACVQGVTAYITPDVLILLHLLPVTSLIYLADRVHTSNFVHVSLKYPVASTVRTLITTFQQHGNSYHSHDWAR